MIDSFQSKFLAAQGRVEDLKRESAARNVARAVRAEKRRCDVETQLAKIRAQLETLEARAASNWEEQRRGSVQEMLLRTRGA